MKNMVISETELQDEDFELHQEIADCLNNLITEKSGFCHKGFIFEIHVNDIDWDKSE